MIVAHNLMAMNAQRQFNIVGNRKAKSTEKLSSGYKINRAADDAAGLAISEKMRRQIRGLSQGTRNTMDGISLCQVADGALAEVDDMLHRITELSVKSANGTNSDSDREAIQQEINQLLTEIDRIGDTTEFNTLKLFKGKTIKQINTELGGEVATPAEVTKDVQFQISASGSPINGLVESHSVSAYVDKGIYFDSLNHSWSEFTSGSQSLSDSQKIGDSEYVYPGNYSLTQNGLTLSINIPEAVKLENVSAALNGTTFNTDVLVDHTASVAVSSMSVYENYSTDYLGYGTHKILADEDGISIEKPSYLPNGLKFDKVSWSSLGIDIENPQAGDYTVKLKSPKMEISFSIADYATKEGVIAALDGSEFEAVPKQTYSIAGGNTNQFMSWSFAAGENETMIEYSAIKGQLSSDMVTKLGIPQESNHWTPFVYKEGRLGLRFSNDDGENVDFMLSDKGYNTLMNSNYSVDNSQLLEFRNGDSYYYLSLKIKAGGSPEKAVSFALNNAKGINVKLLSATGTFVEGGTLDMNGNIGRDERIIGADYSNKVTKESTVPGTKTNTDEGSEVYENLKLWIQTGSEAHVGMYLRIDNMNAGILGIKGLDVSTVAGANYALDAVKGALNKVNSNRSKIGAQQNRLEHTVRNNDNIVENTQAAESQIRDTDMAKEMVQNSMLEILSQAGISMMSQANQSNQGVLSLLQ